MSDDPIYLVYDMSFAGHYDAVQQQVNQLDQQHQDEQLMTSTNQSSNQPQLSCRCGQLIVLSHGIIGLIRWEALFTLSARDTELEN